MIRTLICAGFAALNIPFALSGYAFNAFACGFASMATFSYAVDWLRGR